MISGVKIIDVVSSSNTTIVLTESGKIFQWGCTKQILPKKSTRLAESSDRDQLKPHSVFLSGKGKKLFSGGNHHFVIMENGTVQGWGINGYGQLGVGDEKPHERPRKVKGGLRQKFQLTLQVFPTLCPFLVELLTLLLLPKRVKFTHSEEMPMDNLALAMRRNKKV